MYHCYTPGNGEQEGEYYTCYTPGNGSRKGELSPVTHPGTGAEGNKACYIPGNGEQKERVSQDPIYLPICLPTTLGGIPHPAICLPVPR